MKRSSPSIRSRGYVVAVEGRNDKHVIGRLLRAANIETEIGPIENGGIDELLKSIDAVINFQEVRRFAIVVDANEHPDRRWQAVRDRLVRLGADVPMTPAPEGTIISETEELPRIGIWMMPDYVSSGELEHFVATMIPDDDPIWPLAEAYIEGIPPVHRAFKPQKETRAKVLSWIATREEPGFMGQAISRGDLRTDGELCQRFIAWLDRLFAEAGDVVDPK